MKRLLLSFFLIAAIGFTSIAQELPVPSPRATFKQRVGLTDITIDYSRPGVKDRKIFGKLVPFGELWRTGANAATTIEFSTEVSMQGTKVPAGKYALFTIPDKDGWQVILNKNPDQGGTGDYEKDLDIARFKAKPQSIKPAKESMLIYVDALRNNSAELVLEWENTMISVPFQVRTDERAMENIKKAISSKEADADVYNRSARYYLENDKSTDMALKWAQMSVKMDEKFYNTYTLSKLLHKSGQTKEAIGMAERSMKLAKEAGIDFYVNMNQQNIEKWSKK